jgi:guanylate kinase
MKAPSEIGVLLVVSSPSGAGKTTLCHKLLEEFDDVRFSVSHTTRAPRKGEVDGQDYHFVADAEFDRLVADERFIEWAQVHGNRYGTSRDEIGAAADEGSDLIFDVDYQGARQIKEQYPSAIGVFVLPPSIEELKRRLWSRGTDAEQVLQRRFEAALDEIAQHGLFDYLVVNDDVETAYRDGLRAILLAERHRRARQSVKAEQLLRK